MSSQKGKNVKKKKSLKSKIEKLLEFPLLKWNLRKHPKSTIYYSERVDDFPDSLDPTKIYLVGENGYVWAAAMLCPCGCGDIIKLNLLKKARPCWSVKEHRDGCITISPSIWRKTGCKSHFIIFHGTIHWCTFYDDMPEGVF